MGGKTQTTNQVSTNTPAGLQQLQDIYGRVQQAASTPYTPYTGQLTAGLTDTQQSGISNINAAQGAASPYFNQAAQYATQGAAPISAADIQRYQSPYTQQVIDATKANFAQDNAIGQGQVVGNAAAKGALGGDRVGVAQAELARQQGLAQNPVIAGLQNQGYTQALGAAQQDRAAAAQGAYTFGALAPSVQNAQISGAQAQLGAGAVQQGTNQAGLTANYNQYLQQLAFPYQQAGFLASAGLPAATAMGGTSTGQTSTPGPSPVGQIAGLGLTAASLFSDERIKRNKRQIGKTFDGQPIFSFTYGNDPHTHIGLMAQEVEKKHPEAVGEVGGIKTVDYAAATDDAADKRGFADGGPVNFMDVQGYVPKFGGVQSASPYSSAPQLNMSAPKQQDMPMFSAQQLSGATKGLKGMFPDNSNYDAAMAQTGPTFAGDGIGAMGGVSFPIFARGGRVGFKRGGAVDRADRFARNVHLIRQTLRGGGRVSGYADGGDVGFGDRFGAAYDLTPNDYVARGFGQTRDAIDGGVFDPQGQNAPGPMALADPSPQAAIPLPRPRPDDAPGPMALPSVITAGPGADPDALPDDAMAYGRPQRSPYAMAPDLAPTTPISAMSPSGAPEAAKSQFGSFNPFGLSDDARLALASAGLGMAASKSPFALTQIGEGGQSGIKTYQERLNHKQQVESQARQLAQQASQFAQNLGLHKDQLSETSRRNDIAQDRADTQDRRADEAARRALIPPGYRQTADGGLEPIPGGPASREDNKLIGTNDEGYPVYLDSRTGKEKVGTTKLQGKAPVGYVRNPDGTMTAIKGGPADPEMLEQIARSKRQGSALSDDAISFSADRVLAGDIRALTRLSPDNVAKVQTLVAKKAAEKGIDPGDIIQKVAEGSGLTAQQRTFGTQVARMAVNSTEAQGAIDLGRKASADVPRTTWVPINKLIQMGEGAISDPNLLKFRAANLAIINTYSRAISPTGTPTVHDKEHAEQLLSTATGPAGYNAVLDQMNKEIEIAHAAPTKAKEEMERIRKGGAPTSANASTASDAGAPTAPTVKQNGHTYQRQPDGSYKAID